MREGGLLTLPQSQHKKVDDYYLPENIPYYKYKYLSLISNWLDPEPENLTSRADSAGSLWTITHPPDTESLESP